MPDIVLDIKSRLNIEDVVSRYVPLKRTGRSLKACCPFHAEKTPSFVVSPERQLAYCFGCHKGGDMFAFIQEIEGLDFKGAIDLLADIAGIDKAMYQEHFNAAPKISKDHKVELYGINNSARDFYSNFLWTTKEGKDVLNYLEKRAITAQTIRDFEIGLSPDSFEATSAALFQKNHSKQDLLELGLLISKDTNGEKTHDRFRGRLMFPIWDNQGRIVGFGGRALKPDDEPKYLNSPESVIYHKGDTIYGYHKAKAAIRKDDLVIVVEGYMDLIASHQAGITNVVASSGTAFTPEQFKVLTRLTKNVALSFDTDRAGEEALMRAVLLGQTFNLNMRVIRVPDGKDPDECIKKDPELWKQAIQTAPNYLDYYLKEAGKRFPIQDIEGKKQACAFFLPLLKHASSLEQDHFIRELGFLLQTDPQFIYDEFNRVKKMPSYEKSPARETSKTKASGIPAKATFSQAEYLLGLLLRFPTKVTVEAVSLPDEVFDERTKKIYKRVADLYNSAAFNDAVLVLGALDEEEKRYFEAMMIFAEMRNAELSDDLLAEEIRKAAKQTLLARKENEAVRLMHEIRVAQDEKDVDRERELFQKYSCLYQS
ncbi:MAG: DNA primase [Candidatus Gracilibacteria bacterium]